MRLFSKLFSREADPNKKFAQESIQRAMEAARRPQGPYNAALMGTDLRNRFFALAEGFEAKNGGGWAFGTATAEDALMVNPNFLEEVRNHQPELEIALTHCFSAKDTQKRTMESWPGLVAGYRGKSNSDAVLREKTFLLATYVTNNFNATELAKQWREELAKQRREELAGELREELARELGEKLVKELAKKLAKELGEEKITDEQVCMTQIEEVALWYRVLDELAFRFIRGQRELFADYLQDDLAFHLALLGSPPNLIQETMEARSREYAGYHEWSREFKPEEGKGFGGTLLWEAAKHVGEPIGLHTNLAFLMTFMTCFYEKLNLASVKELLVGE